MHSEMQNILQFYSPTAAFLFAANSDEEKYEWIKALATNIDRQLQVEECRGSYLPSCATIEDAHAPLHANREAKGSAAGDHEEEEEEQEGQGAGQGQGGQRDPGEQRRAGGRQGQEEEEDQ